MLHELFLALYGYEIPFFNSVKTEYSKTSKDSGVTNTDDIPETKEQRVSFPQFKSSPINIIEESSLFHPCELKIIAEILQVANYYKKILSYFDSVVCRNVKDTGSDTSEKLQVGRYLTAFATAIYEETRSYQNKIVQLEKEYLENSGFLLSTVLLEVSPYSSVFLNLGHLINVVQEGKLHGCKTLDFLHKQVTLSVGETHEAFKRILISVQGVFIEQLTHWLLYGDLLDPFHELFLKVTKSSSNSVSLIEEDYGVLDVEVSLDLEMLPEFLPLSAAEKILFIGEGILCFERARQKNKKDYSFRSGMILGKREKEFLDCFEAISVQQSFSLTEFLDLIEAVRLCVTEQLYKLVMDAGLELQLGYVRDIFLAGRGELYQAFFILSETKKPSVTNVNALFQRAGRQIMMDESELDRFTVTWNASETSDKITWKNLKINYKVEWPLSKFFNSETQVKYNAILSFLLTIRQSQLRLQNLWISQKRYKSLRCDSLPQLFWPLRHDMCLLVYNIQNYIQVDVLDPRFDELREEINSVNDYQHVCFRHQAFLASITSQCFLSHPVIHKAIGYILENVNTFCDLVEDSLKPPTQAQMLVVKEDYDRAFSLFFLALNTVGQSRNCQNALQLVMRIDYNKLYSKKLHHRLKDH